MQDLRGSGAEKAHGRDFGLSEPRVRVCENFGPSWAANVRDLRTYHICGQAEAPVPPCPAITSTLWLRSRFGGAGGFACPRRGISSQTLTRAAQKRPVLSRDCEGAVAPRNFASPD